MPLAGGDVDEGAAGEHVDCFGQSPLLVVEVFLEMSAEADYRLGGGSVPMDGQNGAGLDGVQHALGAIGRRVPQIQLENCTNTFTKRSTKNVCLLQPFGAGPVRHRRPHRCGRRPDQISERALAGHNHPAWPAPLHLLLRHQ